jgi:hypothetical protein
VAGRGIDEVGHLGEAGLAIAVDQQVAEGEIGVQRVVIPDQDTDGQIRRDAPGPGEGRRGEGDVGHAPGVEAEAAHRVREVGVDGRFVPAEPVERRAAGPERLVEREQRVSSLRDRLRLGREHGVDGGGAGQGERVDQMGVVEDVLLRGEGTQAVSEQRQRQAGVPLADGRRQGDHVADEAVPAVVPEVTGLGVPAQPVSAVIVGVDGVALGGQCCRERCVAAGVLAHAVGDLDDGSRGRVRFPRVHMDLDAVFAVEGEHRAPSLGYGRVRRAVRRGSRR